MGLMEKKEVGKQVMFEVGSFKKTDRQYISITRNHKATNNLIKRLSNVSNQWVCGTETCSATKGKNCQPMNAFVKNDDSRPPVTEHGFVPQCKNIWDLGLVSSSWFLHRDGEMLEHLRRHCGCCVAGELKKGCYGFHRNLKQNGLEVNFVGFPEEYRGSKMEFGDYWLESPGGCNWIPWSDLCAPLNMRKQRWEDFSHDLKWTD